MHLEGVSKPIDEAHLSGNIMPALRLRSEEKSVLTPLSTMDNL